MKILVLGWEYPPFNSGGLGVACHYLTKYLSRKHKIILVLPRKMKIDFPYGKLIFAEDFLVQRFSGKILEGYKTSWHLNYSSQLIEQVMLYREAIKIICQHFDFDIIHAHDWLTYPAGIEAKNITKKPLIIHVHATEFDRGGGQFVNSAIFHIEKEGLDKADQAIAVSHFTKDKIIRHYQINPEKIAVVHNGIENCFQKKVQNSLMNKILNKKIVIFVGRFTIQKGPDYFLKAAKKTLEYYKDVVFVMSGAGDMERYLIEEVARSGLADKVFFVGFLRDDDLNKLYQSADLFVMPSVSEPFGITTLEAMANGTPALISKQSGVNEVVKHVLKVDFWDIDEMTNKILAVLKYESLKNTLSQNCYRECSKISWADAAEKIHNIYLKFVPAMIYA